MRGAGGAENRRVTLEEAPTPLCCNPLHPARPRNPTREGGGFFIYAGLILYYNKEGYAGTRCSEEGAGVTFFCCFCFFF